MKTNYRSTDYKVNKRYNMKPKKRNDWPLIIAFAIVIVGLLLLGFCANK